MNFYLKTEIDNKTVESWLKKYIYLNSVYVEIPDKLKTYLKDNYNVDIKQILINIRNNIRVIRCEEKLVQVIILNSDINNTPLQSLMHLVEYGNRELPGTHQISLLFRRALENTRDRFRGV